MWLNSAMVEHTPEGILFDQHEQEKAALAQRAYHNGEFSEGLWIKFDLT